MTPPDRSQPDAVREAFEAWAINYCYRLDTVKGGLYCWYKTFRAWKVWQAAYAAGAASNPDAARWKAVEPELIQLKAAVTEPTGSIVTLIDRLSACVGRIAAIMEGQQLTKPGEDVSSAIVANAGECSHCDDGKWWDDSMNIIDCPKCGQPT